MRNRKNATALTAETLRNRVHKEAYSFNEELGRWNYDMDLASDLELEFQEHLATLNSVSVVYTKADRIITGDEISVKVVADDEMESNAMNNGREIVFNACLIENLDEQSITSLHGLNYHEVAHAQFSPRGGSALGKWIVESKNKRAYNILEDSRIERLMTAKYPSTRLFLEASVMDYILNGEVESWADCFILTTGRSYIDLDIRQMVADMFIAKYDKQTAIALAKIIHDFRSLTLADEARYKELVEQFAQYVGHDDEPMKMDIPNGGHSDRDMQTKGRPAPKGEQKELQGRGNDGDDENLDGDSPSTEGDSDESSNAQNAKEGQGQGRGHVSAGAKPSEVNEELRNKINKRIEEVLNNQTVKHGTNEVRKAINGNGKQDSSLGNASYETETVSMENRAIAQRFGAELERLRIENDPMWRLETPSGRLNVGRAMHTDINAIDRVFDRWELGNDNRDIEAVILVDNSGSMYGQIDRTLESAWVIKKALEDIDGRVTVYRFNDESRLLYSADDKASPSTYRTIKSTGNTNPYSGLLEAERILMTSDKAIKMLFIVSDGEWNNQDSNDQIMSRINDIEGALTVSVFLGDLTWYKENDLERYEQTIVRLAHNAKIFHQVSQPKDLVEVATRVVTETMVA